MGRRRYKPDDVIGVYIGISVIGLMKLFLLDFGGIDGTRRYVDGGDLGVLSIVVLRFRYRYRSR